MRRFGTEGRVDPAQHYFVPRTNEIADFINRVRAGKYIVLFAPHRDKRAKQRSSGASLTYSAKDQERDHKLNLHATKPPDRTLLLPHLRLTTSQSALIFRCVAIYQPLSFTRTYQKGSGPKSKAFFRNSGICLLCLSF